MRDVLPPLHCSADGDTFTPSLATLSPIYDSLGRIPRLDLRPIAQDPAQRCVSVCVPLLLGPGGDFRVEIDNPRMSDALGGRVPPTPVNAPNAGQPVKVDMTLVVVALVFLVFVLGICWVLAMCVIRSTGG